MENTTISPPLCSKHGCEKVWGKNSNRKDGGQWYCKPCRNGWPAGQTRRFMAKDWAPPTCEKCGCKQDWVEPIPTFHGYWHCKECRKASKGVWNQSNTKRRKANDRAWAKANPEKRRANSHRRRAREFAATSPLCKVTAAIEAERKALTDGCAFCGADEKLTLDHVVALNDGGLHVPSNLVGACHSCNCSKQDSPVEAWFRAQPFFSEQRWQRIQEITGQGQLSLI